MFGKKRCRNCNKKVSTEYNFCPYCRAPTKDSKEVFDEEEWGLLGKNDSFIEDDIRLPMGFNAIFNSLLKSINSLQEIEANQQPKAKSQKKNLVKKEGISISITTSGNKPPEIKVSSFGNKPKMQTPVEQREDVEKPVKLPKSDSKKFSGLPKKEPKTNIRRLSNKVVYEIDLPGVKSIKDLSLSQLENSIEIKALAKDKVFYKIIPINLPIKSYNLSKGRLVLELDAKD